MKLYIGRLETGDYELGTKKISFKHSWGFPIDNYVYRFCGSDFEKITGLKLAPREIRKVKRIVIEVE